MAIQPKTKIWRNGPSGTVLVQTLPGLPFGVPPFGSNLHVHGIGQVACTGVAKTGMGSTEAVTEVKLTIV